MRDAASHIAFLEEELQKRDEELREREAFWEEKFRGIEDRYTALQSQHTALQSQYAGLLSRYAALEEENKNLRGQVAELEEKLGRNSRNSNQPPSSDKPGDGSKDDSSKGKKRRRKGKKRKRGGQPGHRGSHRMLLPPEQVDHVVDHYPKQCEYCGEELAETPDENPERFQVTEVPPVRPEITEHRGHAVDCPCCGQKNRGRIPDNVKSSAFGARLTSMIVMFTGALHLSRRQAVRAVKDFFNVEISVGAVSAIEGRVAKLLKPVVEPVWEKAREAAVKHTDGTSWLQAGKMLQIWTIATTAVTVFKILSDGTARTLRALFKNAEGILVSDRATALKFWVMKNRQICWAHLFQGPDGYHRRSLERLI
jgi:transposase